MNYAYRSDGVYLDSQDEYETHAKQVEQAQSGNYEGKFKEAGDAFLSQDFSLENSEFKTALSNNDSASQGNCCGTYFNLLSKSIGYAYNKGLFSIFDNGGVSVGGELSSPFELSLFGKGTYGIGLEVGLVRMTGDNGKYNFYITSKRTYESGVAMGFGPQIFKVINNTNSPLKSSVLNGFGKETTGSFFLDGSFGVDNEPTKGRSSKYYNVGFGYSAGIPFGYTNWDTNTFVFD